MFSFAQVAPLKGWIPVSMLHQIAFSGAPTHQSPIAAHQRTPFATHTRHIEKVRKALGRSEKSCICKTC